MPGGRPKKYRTAKAQAEAKQRHNREDYLRRKNCPLQRRPNFIHINPSPSGVPTITRSDIGLPTSANVLIIKGPITQSDQLPEKENTYRPPLAVNDAEVAAVPSRPQESEKEQTNGCTISSYRGVWPWPPNRREHLHQQRAQPLPTGAEAPVHQDLLNQGNKLPENEDAYRKPLAISEVEAAAILSQLRGGGKEQMNKRIVCGQRIMQQATDIDAKTLEILLDMQAGITRLHTSMNRILDHLGIVGTLAEYTD